MNEIVTEYIGIVYMQANCLSCSYSDAVAITNNEVRRTLQNDAKQHARETGHKVAIEKTVATRYTAKKAV